MTEVDQNEAVFTFDVEDEDELETLGVGPCIAVAILNETREWAGLCHFDNLHRRVEELEGFLSEAATAGDPSDHIEIVVGGGDNTDAETTEEIGRAREAALTAVRTYFPATTPRVLWLDAGGAYNVVVGVNGSGISFEPGFAESSDENRS